MAELNNREISLFFWLFLIFIWIISQPTIRSSLYDFIKLLFINPLLWMYFYIISMITIYFIFGFLSPQNFKDVIIWTISVAFAMLFNINKSITNDSFFKNTIIDNIKLVAVIGFISNLYSFNLISEIIIFPIIVFLGMLIPFSDDKKEYLTVNKIFKFLLNIIGWMFILFSVYKTIENIQSVINAVVI